MHIKQYTCTFCTTAENGPEKNPAAAAFFVLGGYLASRIFFRRIFGAIKFFGGGGQIRRLGGLI